MNCIWLVQVSPSSCCSIEGDNNSVAFSEEEIEGGFLRVRPVTKNPEKKCPTKKGSRYPAVVPEKFTFARSRDAVDGGHKEQTPILPPHALMMGKKVPVKAGCPKRTCSRCKTPQAWKARTPPLSNCKSSYCRQ